MKHALLAALAILYWVVVGHGHTWHVLLALLALLFWPIVGAGHSVYFVALALAAIRNDAQRDNERYFVQ